MGDFDPTTYNVKLTVYCNYDIPPFATTTYVNGMSPEVIERVFKQIEKFVPLSSLPYETAMSIVKDYYNLCFRPSPSVAELDPDKYIIHNLDLTKYQLQPTNFINLSNLIVEAVTWNTRDKHIRINVNSMEFLNVVRYAVFKEKLKPEVVTINVNTSDTGVQTYGVNKYARFLDLDNNVTEIPKVFAAPYLDKLLEMF